MKLRDGSLAAGLPVWFGSRGAAPPRAKFFLPPTPTMLIYTTRDVSYLVPGFCQGTGQSPSLHGILSLDLAPNLVHGDVTVGACIFSSLP